MPDFTPVTIASTPVLSALVATMPDPSYSHEEVTILGGSGAARVIAFGQLLGEVSVGAVSAAAAAGNAGTATITVHATPTAAGVRPGVYRAVITEPAANLGSGQVEDPDGVVIGRFTVGTLFDGVVKFTIADAGATDAGVGDLFLITVAAPAARKYVAHDPAAADGSQIIAGLALEPVTAANGVDTTAVALLRGSNGVIVKREAIVHAAGRDAAGKAADYAALLSRLGIVSVVTG